MAHFKFDTTRDIDELVTLKKCVDILEGQRETEEAKRYIRNIATAIHNKIERLRNNLPPVYGSDYAISEAVNIAEKFGDLSLSEKFHILKVQYPYWTFETGSPI